LSNYHCPFHPFEITGHYENKELNESDQITFVIWVAPPVSSTFDRRQYMMLKMV